MPYGAAAGVPQCFQDRILRAWISEGGGSWGHHHVLPVLGSLSSPWETFPGRQSWTHTVRPAAFCSPQPHCGYPGASRASQHPCPTCHFCSITSWLLTSTPDTGSRKPVFQSARNQNKALPRTAGIKTCTLWGWLLPPQITDSQSSRRTFGEEKAPLGRAETGKVLWETPPKLWLLSVAIQYLRQHL